MKLIKTANKTKIKLSKKEWQDIGKTAGWGTLDDDINEIEGEIISWIENYMDNYPQEQWLEKQAFFYGEIEKFCKRRREDFELKGEELKDVKNAIEYSQNIQDSFDEMIEKDNIDNFFNKY